MSGVQNLIFYRLIIYLSSSLDNSLSKFIVFDVFKIPLTQGFANSSAQRFKLKFSIKKKH